MLTSTAVALMAFVMQVTSWKSLLAMPSEDSKPSKKLANSENYSAPRTTGPVQLDACVGDYFNRHYFHQSKPVSYDLADYISSPKTSCNYRASCCRPSRVIREYSKQDVVRCFDSLSVKRNRQPMHIAFVGDSTVRHHYLSFLRVGFVICCCCCKISFCMYAKGHLKNCL